MEGFMDIGSSELTVVISTLDTLLFIFLSLLITAVSFYLPHHVAIIAKRAWYYYAGDSTVLDTRALEGLKEL
jgi:hypothetical protein